MGHGFIAKFWEDVTQAGEGRLSVNPGLGRKSEQFADEVSLTDHISISQPFHSALPDHVHGLDTLQRPPRTSKRSVALGQPNSLFDRPVVLFNHVIEILALRKATRRGMVPSAFSASTAAGYAGFLSTLITRGIGFPDASIALRRKRLTAAVSRLDRE
jgi:hypothetical protein